MVMQSCYQHPLHEHDADNNIAFKAVATGKRYTLRSSLLHAPVLSKALKPIPSLYRA